MRPPRGGGIEGSKGRVARVSVLLGMGRPEGGIELKRRVLLDVAIVVMA